MSELRKPDESRRGFIRGSSLLLAGAIPAGLTSTTGLAVASAEKAPISVALPIRVGLIGCGARGVALAQQLLRANPNGADVCVTALADVFADRVQQALRTLKGKYSNQILVDSAHRFTGLQSYQQLLATDVDLVILATPPGFRPIHFEEAVAASKHVFAEKPIAVDAPGVQRFWAANEQAFAQNLVVGVGLDRRSDSLTCAMVNELHAGAVGQILLARAHLSCTLSAPSVRRRSQSELEYQLRNWQHFQWISGDSLVEQHVQNLDLINWVLQSHPLEAQGVGGRKPTLMKTEGDILDHYCVEYAYRGGVKLISICEQRVDGGGRRARLSVHGTRGWCDLSAGKIYNLQNELIWRATDQEFSVPSSDASRVLEAIARAACLNEVPSACEATLTAILGRMASQSGRLQTWGECVSSKTMLADVDALKKLQDPKPV